MTDIKNIFKTATANVGSSFGHVPQSPVFNIADAFQKRGINVGNDNNSL